MLQREEAELRDRGLLPCPLDDGLLGTLPLGQVAGHLGVADQHSPLVPDRIQDDVRPEPRAVLAQPPAFLLETAFAGGDLQLQPRFPGAQFLLRIEPLEAVPDDLACRVPFEALRAWVPAGHGAVGLEQEDGVLPDPLERERSVPEERWPRLRIRHVGSIARDPRTIGSGSAYRGGPPPRNPFPL